MLERIEELIRQGEFQKADKIIRKIRPSKVPRREACAMANAARRIDRPLIALRVLNPIVRPADKLHEPATDFEKIEYAECLRRLGIIQEAWQILQTVPAGDHPQVLLHQTFCLFNQWNYKDAIPLLKNYVQDPRLAPYARLVGQVNLAAALIFDEVLGEADLLLEQLRRDTKEQDHKLLFGNCLELSCQLRILQRDWRSATEFIDESNRVLSLAGKMQSLLAQKWLAISKAFQNKDHLDDIRAVREKARQTGHWETIRDCDFYLARLTGDHDLFRHLYFGTPFNSFRERILRTVGSDFSLPADFLWSATKSPKAILNLAQGCVEGPWSGKPLSGGHSVHRFLNLVCRDFYRPLPVLSGFASLFPGEYMNPLTSANRVHQVALRTRNWLKQNHFPAALEELNGAYRLNLKEISGVKTRTALPSLGSQEVQWERLRQHFNETPFSIREAASVLNCSLSSAQRLLRWALQKKQADRRGRSSDICYQIKNFKAA